MCPEAAEYCAMEARHLEDQPLNPLTQDISNLVYSTPCLALIYSIGWISLIVTSSSSLSGISLHLCELQPSFGRKVTISGDFLFSFECIPLFFFTNFFKKLLCSLCFEGEYKLDLVWIFSDGDKKGILLCFTYSSLHTFVVLQIALK